MDCMCPAKFTIFPYFQLIRGILFIFGCRIVPAFTACA